MDFLKVFYKYKTNTLLAEGDNIKYGQLFVPFFKVMIYDKKDFDKFLKIVDKKLKNKNITLSIDDDSLYQKRMQLYAHEYFHLYQILSLESLSIQTYILREKLKYEAISFLKCYENCQKPLYNFTKDSIDGLLELIIKLDDKDLLNKIKRLSGVYEYFSEVWLYEKNGISLYSLVESMAHVYSLKVNGSFNDVLGLEKNPIYTKPYQYFLQNFDEKQVDDAWKQTLFLYVCYFSLKNFINFRDKNKSRIVDTFIFLSSNMEKYLKYLSIKKKEYELFDIKEIDSYLSDKVLYGEYLEYGNKEQKSSLAALFETIELIKDNAKVYKNNKKHSDYIKEFDNYINIAKNLGIDLESDYLLANLSIYPESFSYLMDMHDKIMTNKQKKVDFNNEQEAEFYDIIDRCNKLIEKNADIYCCEKHGVISDKYTILNCTYEDSLSMYIKNWLKTELKDLFWVR
jgi:hypothetical protein